MLLRLREAIGTLDLIHVHFVVLVRDDVDLCATTLLCLKNDVPFDRIIIILDAVIEPLDVPVVFVRVKHLW